MIERIYNFLLGDDIFISYSRADGTTYATGLASELVSRKFSCRLDQWGTEAGKEVPASLRRALRRSAILVLVGTEGAARSQNVAQEIVDFKQTGRVIVPIVFDGTLLRNNLTCRNGKLIRSGESASPGGQRESGGAASIKADEALWAQEIEGLAIFCESLAALKNGTPSTEVISRIEKTFTFSRKDERLRKTSIAVSILLSLLIAASVVAARFAAVKAVEATEKAQIAAKATKEANLAEERARTANDKAVLQESMARSREFAAQAVSEMDKQLAVALSYSLMAFDETPSPTLEAKQSLLAGLTYAPHFGSFVTRDHSGYGGLAVSADAQLIVSNTNPIQLWRNTSRPVEPQILFERADASSQAVTITQDGKTVAAGFDDNTVRFCDTATADEGKKVLKYPGKIDALAFNAPGDKLAVGLRDGAVYVWDVGSDSPTGRLLGSHPAKPEREIDITITLMAFSPDDKNLASYSTAGSLIMWDLMRQKGEKKLATMEYDIVRTLSFSPDSRLLAFNSGRLIELWDRKSRKLAMRFDDKRTPFVLAVGKGRETVDDPEDEVICLAFRAENDELVSVSEWQHLCRWRFTWSDDDQGRTCLVHELAAYDSSDVLLKGPVSVGNAVFANDGRMIISQSTDGITTWNVDPQPTLCSVFDTGHDVIFNPVTGSLISVGNYGMAVWEGSRRTIVKENIPSPGATTSVETSKGWQSLAISADGKRIIARGWTDKYTSLDADSYTTRYSFTLPENENMRDRVVTFDPDLRLAVAADMDGEYYIWEIGEQPVRLASIEGVPPFAFGKHILIGRGCGGVCRWEIADPKKPHLLDEAPLDGVATSLALSGDGKLLAVVCYGGSVSLWSLGQELHPLTLRGDIPAKYIRIPTGSCVTFSPDNQMLAASGHGSASVTLWDISKGRLLGHVPAASYGVEKLSFSPDGRRLAAVAGDLMVVDVDPDSWKERARAMIGSSESGKK